MPPSRRAINSSRILHLPTLKFWQRCEQQYLGDSLRLKTRFQRAVEKREHKFNPDKTVEAVKDTFHNGFGIKWSDDQVKVFEAGLSACLPYIYGDSWGDQKMRVLKEWGLAREMMYLLVNMARRNGKTFVCSGLVCALLICVPRIKVAIFATCLRTAHMFMEQVLNMMERGRNKGTHVTEQSLSIVQKNMETAVFQAEDGTRRIVGCFPGSVRVSVLFFYFFGGGGER